MKEKKGAPRVEADAGRASTAVEVSSTAAVAGGRAT